MTRLVLANGRPQLQAVIASTPDLSSLLLLDLEAEDGAGGAVAEAEKVGIPTITIRELASRDVQISSAVIVQPAAAAAVEIALAIHGQGCPVVQRELPRPVSLVDDAVSVKRLKVIPADTGDVPTNGSWSLRTAVRNPLAEAGRKWRPGADGAYAHAQSDRQAIADLKDAYKGQTCVVIGNGPSLNLIDLSLLKTVPTFGVNSLFLARDRMGFDPTFFVVEDTAVMADNVEAVRQVHATDLKLFPTMYREQLDGTSVGKNVYFTMNGGFYDRRSPNYCTPRFSTAADQQVFTGQSVTIINLQLAYHFGFTRVVLIGMDFSYVIPDSVVRDGDLLTSTEDDPNHFDPSYFGAGKQWKDPKLDRVLSNYELARAAFEADGREIINSTVGGKLELFPRLDLADALGGAPAPAPAL